METAVTTGCLSKWGGVGVGGCLYLALHVDCSNHRLSVEEGVWVACILHHNLTVMETAEATGCLSKGGGGGGCLYLAS